MLRSRKPSSASRLTSGTISGTSGSMRNCEVLSITTQPAAAARGACTLETAAPGENRPRSKPSKSKSSSARTVSTSSSPKLTSLPAEPLEASATTSLTGNCRSARMFSISWPTAPVAPTTATSVAHVFDPAAKVCAQTLGIIRAASRANKAIRSDGMLFAAEAGPCRSCCGSADRRCRRRRGAPASPIETAAEATRLLSRALVLEVGDDLGPFLGRH